ncbi:glycosyltransferase family 2 protein [Kozakia baliensis]|uniref:glycosyltransferase family 2 protein n=1 Tax=Kozakia baliensis TaxID=153496 RepID=UPI00087A34B7|nr:glycosyltransferase [Kozakia baliensis]AOX20948.1 hypothetical protein A0U90_12400 [Kozakia baliensis]
MRTRIGIAITTYNRHDNLLKQIETIKRLSILDFDIIVCDDGSSDNTRAALADRDIPFIGNKNRGVAWNKNRGLFYLFNYTKVDIVILMDDDVLPHIYGWDVEWFESSMKYGHVNYLPASLEQHVIGGDLTTENIGISPLVGGMCMAISREAFSSVGYMDVRFGRYGHEHSDYSSRFIRSGYGGFKDSSKNTYFYVIHGGVHLSDLPSTGTAEEANKNRELLFEIANDPIYRLPWIDEVGRAAFLADFSHLSTRVIPDIEKIASSFDEELYYEANPDVKKAAVRGLHHYISFGRSEKRPLKPE